MATWLCILATFVAFFAVSELNCCLGEVIVFNFYTNVTVKIEAWPARFGNFEEEQEGWIRDVRPANACSPLPILPMPGPRDRPYIALVSRGDCEFDIKAVNVQNANYRGMIVKNYNNDQLFTMDGGSVSDQVEIPVVLVKQRDGDRINTSYVHRLNRNVTAVVDDYYVPPQWHLYLYPFVIIVGVCVFLLAVFMAIRYRRERHERHRRRLPRVNLKKLPTKKWKKGEDDYETCAICLEDYCDGDKLRILPCEHAYHCKCVDKWLTSRSRTCPVCKFSIGSDDDSEAGPEVREPRPQRHRRRRRRPRPAAAALTDDDSLSGSSGDEENAPLVTQLSSSSGEYGARGSSGRTSSSRTSSVIMSPLHARSVVVSDSESDEQSQRSSSRVVRVRAGGEQLPSEMVNSSV